MVKQSKDLNHHTMERNRLKYLNHFKVERNKSPNYLDCTITGLYPARLLGANGMEDHWVVITQNWIFDSNF